MIDRPIEREYRVPRRFGVGTILVVTALFAALCGVIKWTAASPLDLVIYSSFVIVVGGAQMILERSPRLGSILAGTIFLPIALLAAFMMEQSQSASGGGRFIPELDAALVFWILASGAMLGYLGGTVLAGLFLVLDKIQRVVVRRHKSRGMPTEAS